MKRCFYTDAQHPRSLVPTISDLLPSLLLSSHSGCLAALSPSQKWFFYLLDYGLQSFLSWISTYFVILGSLFLNTLLYACTHTQSHLLSPPHISLQQCRSSSAKQTLPSHRSSLVWKISLAFCAVCQDVKWFPTHTDAQFLLTA